MPPPSPTTENPKERPEGGPQTVSQRSDSTPPFPPYRTQPPPHPPLTAPAVGRGRPSDRTAMMASWSLDSSDVGPGPGTGPGPAASGPDQPPLPASAASASSQPRASPAAPAPGPALAPSPRRQLPSPTSRSPVRAYRVGHTVEGPVRLSPPPRDGQGRDPPGPDPVPAAEAAAAAASWEETDVPVPVRDRCGGGWGGGRWAPRGAARRARGGAPVGRHYGEKNRHVRRQGGGRRHLQGAGSLRPRGLLRVRPRGRETRGRRRRPRRQDRAAHHGVPGSAAGGGPGLPDRGAAGGRHVVLRPAGAAGRGRKRGAAGAGSSEGEAAPRRPSTHGPDNAHVGGRGALPGGCGLVGGGGGGLRGRGVVTYSY